MCITNGTFQNNQENTSMHTYMHTSTFINGYKPHTKSGSSGKQISQPSNRSHSACNGTLGTFLQRHRRLFKIYFVFQVNAVNVCNKDSTIRTWMNVNEVGAIFFLHTHTLLLSNVE